MSKYNEMLAKMMADDRATDVPVQDRAYGATDDLFTGPQTADIANPQPPTVSPRMSELIKMYIEKVAGKKEFRPHGSASLIFEDNPLVRYDARVNASPMAAIANNPNKWMRYEYTRDSRSENIGDWDIPVVEENYIDSSDEAIKLFPSGMVGERTTYRPDIMYYNPTLEVGPDETGAMNFSGYAEPPTDEDIAMHIASSAPVYASMIKGKDPSADMFRELQVSGRTKIPATLATYHKIGWTSPEDIVANPELYIKSGWATPEQIEQVREWIKSRSSR